MEQAPTESARFTFYLLDGFAMNGFSAAIEALRIANRVAGRMVYVWDVVTGTGGPALSACGIPVAADYSLGKASEWLYRAGALQFVIVCGGDGIPVPDRALEAWLRLCQRSRIALAGFAGGLYPLARAGILDGKPCAVHWEHFPDFSERFFAAEARQSAFEIAPDLYTCAGGNASFDMFLHIIESDLGRDVANRICEFALCERLRQAGERQRLPMQARLGIENGALLRVIRLMEENISEPFRLADMSLVSGLSRRQVERLFNQEMGRTPARYYRDLRLERARLLLATTSQPVIDIAIACGFATASHFARTYRQRYGCTPQMTRLIEAERRALSNGHRARIAVEKRQVA